MYSLSKGLFAYVPLIRKQSLGALPLRLKVAPEPPITPALELRGVAVGVVGSRAKADSPVPLASRVRPVEMRGNSGSR